MTEYKPDAQLFDDGLETNLSEIARQIFSKPPSRPYSIGLQLDHPIDSQKSADQVLQEMLLFFLLCGIEIKYGSNVSFKDLTDTQRTTLRHYMWSVGYDPVIHMESTTFWIEFLPYRVGL